MHPRLRNQLVELQGVLQGHALRPAERHRVLHRAVEQPGDAEQDDEVEQEGGDHLVDAKPRLHQRRAEKDDCACEGRRKQHQRQQQPR